MNGTNQYLLRGGAVVSAVPLTMAAWAFSNQASGNEAVIAVYDTGGQPDKFGLYFGGAQSGDPILALVYGSGWSWAESAGGYSTGTWHHLAATFTSSTSRAAFLDGGNKGTDTGNQTPAGIDTTAVGRDEYGRYHTGGVAEAAVWNAALSEEEIAILGEGFCPLFVRPQNLVAYWSLLRTDNDVVGGYNLTPYNSPTWVDHPRIIYPSRPQIVTAPAAAATNIPEFMRYYRNRRCA
jgi:hypothetical protein